MKMTLTKLRELNKKNGGAFFNRDSMKFFGDTMKTLGIRPTILKGFVEVYRKNKSGSWIFNEATGRVSHSIGIV